MPRDSPFLIAVGWQFAIWGAIDLIFVIAGFRKNATLEVDDVAETASLVRALRFNGKWMNPMWLAMGVVLLIWGFAAHNNLSLLGHGAGVLDPSRISLRVRPRLSQSAHRCRMKRRDA